MDNKILITVLGSSPAVVTETLFALKEQHPFPSRVICYTTAHGAKTFSQQNLPESINQLCLDYNLPAIAPEDILIKVVTDKQGQPLEDIRNEEEQDGMADYLTQEIRTLTQDSNTVIHASLAGGRKSMSFYMGYIFSMFARSEDELSHVLVEQKYETRGFLYPTPKSHLIKNQRGELIDCKDAKIELAKVPFIRLNQSLESYNADFFNNNKNDYSSTIEAFQLSLTPEKIQLTLDKKNNQVIVNNKILHLSSLTYAFYSLIIEHSKHESFHFTTKNIEVEPTNIILGRLAEMAGYIPKEDCIFDESEEIFDHLEANKNLIKIGTRSKETIVNKGFTKAMINTSRENIEEALKQYFVGRVINLCLPNTINTEITYSDKAEYRKTTKNSAYGILLNPNQITIIS